MTDIIEDYLAVFRNISRGSLPRLHNLCTPDLQFRDPFNDVRGIEPVIHMFLRMFDVLDEPKFLILNHVASGAVCYVRWQFQFRRRGQPAEYSIDGMSELRIAPDGRIAGHFDYWDSGMGIFAKIPVLGFFIRQIAKRMA